LTIAELTIDDFSLMIGGGISGGRSAIVNDSILNWPATPEAASTQSLHGAQRDQALIVEAGSRRILEVQWTGAG
jgi:hypothetical protein